MSARKTSLHYREGNSDKIYEVEIVNAPPRSNYLWLVNFAYGRRGSILKIGTKTRGSVPLYEAERIYNDLIRQKRNKGYTIVSSSESTELIENRIREQPSIRSKPIQKSNKIKVEDDYRAIEL